MRPEYPNFPLNDVLKDFDSDIRRCANRNDRCELVDLLNRRAGLAHIGALVDAVLNEPRLLAACAENSIIHPLGFEQLLLSSTSAYQLRMHVWRAEEVRRFEDIHDHRFSFVSAVLAGSLYLRTFFPSEQGVLNKRLLCHPGESYVMRDDGVVRVQEGGSVMLTAGGAYYTSSRSLHSVSASPGVFVATLFLKLQSERNTAVVLVDPAVDRPTVVQRHAFSVQEYSNRLQSARREIAQSDTRSMDRNGFGPWAPAGWSAGSGRRPPR